jgi:hypothetical protein
MSQLQIKIGGPVPEHWSNYRRGPYAIEQVTTGDQVAYQFMSGPKTFDEIIARGAIPGMADALHR